MPPSTCRAPVQTSCFKNYSVTASIDPHAVCWLEIAIGTSVKLDHVLISLSSFVQHITNDDRLLPGMGPQVLLPVRTFTATVPITLRAVTQYSRGRWQVCLSLGPWLGLQRIVRCILTACR